MEKMWPVASRIWNNNCKLDEILTRDNWKSENIFAMYYYKVMASKPATASCDVTTLFNPNEPN